jgi:hypothetical protein
MKHIALFVMSILLKKAKREKIGKELIIQQAYDGMIDSYETTILFIKANIKGTKGTKGTYQTKSEKSYSAIDWNEMN